MNLCFAAASNHGGMCREFSINSSRTAREWLSLDKFSDSFQFIAESSCVVRMNSVLSLLGIAARPPASRAACRVVARGGSSGTTLEPLFLLSHRILMYSHYVDRFTREL